MKKHIQIKNSYKIWDPSTMEHIIDKAVPTKNHFLLVIEWWIHNIIYWLTKPFTKNTTIKSVNDRCKDVDLDIEIDLECGDFYCNGKKDFCVDHLTKCAECVHYDGNGGYYVKDGDENV